jgi:hypothetical protein
MNQMLRSKAATNLCTPNAAARPATSVTAKAASTSQPQASPPIPNPSAVTPAPMSAKTAMRDAPYPKPPPGSASAANSTPNRALRRYSSCPIAQKTTSGTNATSRIITPRGQLSPAGLSSNTFDSQPMIFPR